MKLVAQTARLRYEFFVTKFYVAVIAPRDEPIVRQRPVKRTARHAER